MERILVTGSNGQLGKSIQEISENYKDQFQFFFTDIEDLDITQKEKIIEYCRENRIDVIINAAAFTAVDQAENEPELCYKINTTGVKNLADCSKELGLFMVHISTDYVFDGTSLVPYRESDSTHPISVYGKSKLEGELEMQASGTHGVIIRTSWLYSIYGKNFLKTILSLSYEKNELKVVNDQYGTPTNAADLAFIILKLIEDRNRIHGTELFHFSNSGRCTWYEFAQCIVEKAGNNCTVLPISTDGFVTKAKRPQHSELSKEKLTHFLDIEICDWKLRVEETVKKLI